MKFKSLKLWMPAMVICLVAACLTTACGSMKQVLDKHQKETVLNIPYDVLNNYFLKNNVVGISYPHPPRGRNEDFVLYVHFV